MHTTPSPVRSWTPQAPVSVTATRLALSPHTASRWLPPWSVPSSSICTISSLGEKERLYCIAFRNMIAETRIVLLYLVFHK